MQDDGNLVLYVQNESGEWKPKFSSETNGYPNTYCLMREDGNLILYEDTDLRHWPPGGPNTPGVQGLWDAGTNRKPGAYLKMWIVETLV